MKPGWVLTNVGGIRYDGTHYSLGGEGDIEVYTGSKLVRTLSYSNIERIRSRAPVIVDRKSPPLGWRYLGYAILDRNVNHAWRKEKAGIQIHWNKDETLMIHDSDESVWELKPSPNTPSGVFREILEARQDLILRKSPWDKETLCKHFLYNRVLGDIE